VCAEVGGAPAEEQLPGRGQAGVEGADVPRLQRRPPHVEVGDIPKKRLREVPSERVLVLTQDEDPVPVDAPGGVGAGARVPSVPVHVDGPEAAAPPPRDAHVVPRPVVGEGRLVGEVLPVDDERQQDAALQVHLAPQLELVGEDGRGVGEDGGHLGPRRVPLDADAHADGRQRREGHVDAGEALEGLLREVQS